MKINPKEYFKSTNTELNGIYRGIIEDNNDPDKLGRCKIRIFGIHSPNKIKNKFDGIPTDELPWSEPVLGLFEGSVSGFGAWTVPLQGSHVMVFFEGGNILQPRYFASVPGKPSDQNHGLNENQGFSDPDNNYPVKTRVFPHKPNQLNDSDYHKLATAQNTGQTIVQNKNNNKETGIEKANGGSWDEPSSYYNATYPNNKVFATHSGITIEIDDTENEERIHIYHPSNTFIEIDKNGNVNIKTNKDKFEIVKGNENKLVKEEKSLTVDSNNYENIKGNDKKYIAGQKIHYTANTVDNSVASVWNMAGGSIINIDAPIINLNCGNASLISPK